MVPLCETFRDDGYSTEEMKLLFETRKILDDPSFEVAMTCVRVPVPVGHSTSVLLETERADHARRGARARSRRSRACVVMDDPTHNVFPTPADARRARRGVRRARSAAT